MLSSFRISWNLQKNSLKFLKKNLNHQNAMTTLKHLKTSAPKNGTIAITEVSSKSKTIGLWLAGCSGMVAGAVVLGGVTRYLNFCT